MTGQYWSSHLEKKKSRDFRLQSWACCCEYVTQVVQKTSRVGVHQWAHTHLLIVFRSGTVSTLAPCGSLLNLMIYTQAHERCLETVRFWQVVQFPWKLWISSCLPVSEPLCCQSFRGMIIVILAVTDFHSSATKSGINHTQWCSLTVLLNLNVAFSQNLSEKTKFSTQRNSS